MVRVVIERNLKELTAFIGVSKRLQSRDWRGELHKGVIDAGRKTRTKVSKAVSQQMNVASGHYQSYVVANMRFRSNLGAMSATISASEKGGQITDFKGLRNLKMGGRAAKRGGGGPTGTVRSEVWGSSRVFKRSFASGGGFFALIRANGARGNSTMPKAFWTHDPTGQARDAKGRFAATGAQKWRTRRLRGPAINKELDKDQSLQVFLTFGPAELDRQIDKRLVKIMKW